MYMCQFFVNIFNVKLLSFYTNFFKQCNKYLDKIIPSILFFALLDFLYNFFSIKVSKPEIYLTPLSLSLIIVGLYFIYKYSVKLDVLYLKI